MTQLQIAPSTVQAPALQRFVAELLTSAGLPDVDAETVSECLVHANLRGIDSHGVARLPHYLRRIQAGSINPRPTLRYEAVAPAAGRLDAGHALGHLAMAHATGHAIDLAREAGAGWVALSNSSHCGALPYYGLRIAEAGMIGLVFTHVDTLVIPFGSAQPFCGTNPLCFTAPGPDGQALCLDMSTSVTAWNRIENAATENETIPSGWGVDASGNDTTDPKQVRAIRPVGGHKGSGLGLMIDVFCAMLTNSPFGPNIPKMYGNLAEKRRLGGLVGAISVEAFLDRSQFERRVGELMRQWNALNPSEPGKRVLWPGEPEQMTARQRAEYGIPIGAGVIEQLNTLADALGVARLEDT